MKDSAYSPIVLFVYNRPDHTRRTIEALKCNPLAIESDLIIYSDAPRSRMQVDAVNEVRQYIREIMGFKSVTLYEREYNWGLANSVIDGVTTVVNCYGRAIVLEDDLLTSPHFLSYMNDALNVYENETRVMHVSGFMFPVGSIEKLPDTFFYRAASCWGWATWARAWKVFEPNANKLFKDIATRKLESQFDIGDSLKYTKMLKNQASGVINSWAIRWYASIFLNGGMCLHPAKSLVKNIGHDGTGVHCDAISAYEVEVSDEPVAVEWQEIQESPAGLAAIKEFNQSLHFPLQMRLYLWLARRLRKVIG